MGEFSNKPFQKYFAIISTLIIVIAAVFTVVAAFWQ